MRDALFANATTMTELLAHLLALYLALGLMLVGFGYMLFGKLGGARAAQFYFARSLRWALRHGHALFMTVLITVWGAFVLWIGRPLVHRLLRALQWCVRRERGWLRSQ